MRRIDFAKIVASGNDFVVAEIKARDSELKGLAVSMCDRKFGAGADGLLVLEDSETADVRMRIFNPDGSEASMCGNGARCVALFTSAKKSARLKNTEVCIETRAGVIDARVNGDVVKIKLTDPKDIRLDIPLRIDSRNLRVNFINTGVPHTVIFVEGLSAMDVARLGRSIRYHRKFSPAGTNVDFVEALGRDSIKLRTYERGVEDETLACGTGSVASALIFALKSHTANMIQVHTRGREVLKVHFARRGKAFNDVWLEGRARIVYKGAYYV